jgi:RNA polymerase sigma-70 factor (ECF subfamily)
MISNEDQRLINLCLAGNRLAQRDIYVKYVQAMYHVAIRMVTEESIAKDMAQDTFVKVFEELGSFRGESTLGAWIKRITINTCLVHLRRKGHLQIKELDVATLKVADDRGEFLVEEVDMIMIHEAIKSLPVGCRTILTLYLLEGYRHNEIAKILDISLSTSKTQYRRGKLLLRDKLKTVYYNEG